MADFPNIKPLSKLSQKTIKPAYRGKSSAGYMMSHARATVKKKEFKITYRRLTKAERDTLDTFFDENSGIEFNWTHPEADGAVYQVLFMQDDLDFIWSPPCYWSTTFTIREV